MATNDFIGFASSGNANVASQADYSAATEQGIGMQSGPASSKLANKAWRQGANMAAALGRITAARGYDALDNGDLDALQTSVADAISIGTFNRMYFSQTSGSYTAPRTGVYRITLKGGGGGGGGAQTTTGKCSGGGGEGAKNTIYANLIKNTAYPYVIGAGGSAGVSSATYSEVTGGSSGGTTNITISGTTYTALGGGGGLNSQTSARGGMGGGVSTGGYCEPGANGTCGLTSDSYGYGRASGGGHGGYGADPALYGGGGSGGYSTNAATNGAAGYILIEYAG